MKCCNKILPFLPIIGQVAGVLFIVLIGYLIYRKFTGESERDTIYDQDIDSDKLSYEKSQYIVFADKIQTAAEGLGTDEDKIYEVFSAMSTNSDVLELIKSFGKRWFQNGFGLYYNASLTEVLQHELSAKDLATVNEILTDKNITIKF